MGGKRPGREKAVRMVMPSMQGARYRMLLAYCPWVPSLHGQDNHTEWLGTRKLVDLSAPEDPLPHQPSLDLPWPQSSYIPEARQLVRVPFATSGLCHSPSHF